MINLLRDIFLNVWHIDVLTQYALLVLAFVTVSGVMVSINTLRHDIASGVVELRDIPRFGILGAICVIAFAVSLLTTNLALLWIALETITVCTAFIIAFYRRPGSREAAMQYLKLSSIGVVAGFVGMVFLVKTGMATGISWWDALSLEKLLIAFPPNGVTVESTPPMLKMAFALLFLGLGAKMGLVPMQQWATEAYSKMSSPVSGLLSAMLPLTSFLVLLRIRQIVDGSMGDGGTWTGWFFLAFGTLSAVVTAVMLLRQHNYKRMTSAVALHHSALAVFMVGLGPAGLIPALIHVFTRSIVVSGLFAVTGVVHGTYKTSKFSGVHDMERILPVTAALFIILIASTLAIPFSGFFTSEIIGFGYGLQENLLVTVIVFAATILASAQILRYAMAMMFPAPEPIVATVQPKEWRISNSILALHVLLIFALGVYITTQGGIRAVILAAQAVASL
jgi:hydrogenase-4 component F